MRRGQACEVPFLHSPFPILSSVFQPPLLISPLSIPALKRPTMSAERYTLRQLSRHFPPAPQDSLLAANFLIPLGTSLFAPQIRHLLTLCAFIYFICLLTFTYLLTSFLVCCYVFRIPTSISCIKVIGSRSRSREQNGIFERNQIHTFAGGSPSVKRQSCFVAVFW